MKRAADDGPVLITHRGEVSHVLLPVSEYRRLTGERRSLVDALGMAEDVDFDPPRIEIGMRPADLS